MLNYSLKDLDDLKISSDRVVHNPLVARSSHFEKNEIQIKAKKLLDEIEISLKKNDQTFGREQLNNLKTIADQLECDSCKHVLRYLFRESAEIERFSQVFRERFDIAFSQAVRRVFFSFFFVLKFRLVRLFLFS